eukprot:evm.model.NODE_3998_length_11613_cov_18.861534.2
MIANFLSGGGEPKGIPRSIKDGINGLRFAMQRALRDRKSRVEVNLPRGTPLGVEGPGAGSSADDKYEKADRELARLTVELFNPIIENTVVIFSQGRQARRASSIWGTEVVKTMAWDEMTSTAIKRKNKKAKRGAGGFGADGRGENSATSLPPGTEVCIVVAPGPKELSAVKRLSDSMGFDTLIIVLNTPLDQAAPYLPKDEATALLSAFETVFFLNVLNDPSVKTLDNMLLFKSYPGEWLIAQKGALGPPQILASNVERFTEEERLVALRKGAENNAKPLMEKLTAGLFGSG